MSCEEIVEFLADYLEGTLSDERRLEFEEHLDCCPDCVAYLTTYAATPDILRAAFSADVAVEAMPEDIIQAIVKVLDQRF